MEEPRKKKSIFKKWWFWVIVVVIAFAMLVFGGDSEKEPVDTSSTQTEQVSDTAEQVTVESTDAVTEALTDQITEKEISEEEQLETEVLSDSSYNDKASLYEFLGENEAMPYVISPKAKTFIQENESLFPVDSEVLLTEYVDENLSYKNISKNQNNYGDKMMFIDQAYVGQINETNMDENTVFTEMQVWDLEENCYYILYMGSLPDVFAEDVIKLYGTPLGMTSFSNVSGGSTLAVVMAGSYIEKLE